nr:hypothetical protein [uncultured Lachnoclostridium sp.]
MIGVLNEISSQGIFTVILCVVLVLLLIIEGAKLWKGTLESLDLKSGKELRENALNERLDALESKIKAVENSFMNDQEKYHNQSIEIRDGLSNQITELNTMMSNFIDTSNQCTVASFRSSLWRMHRDFTSQGYITPDGLKTFLEMGKLYEFVGGDDIYHQILLPDIEALEIKYSKDSVL